MKALNGFGATEDENGKKTGLYGEEMSPELREYLNEVHKNLNVGYSDISQHKRNNSEEEDEL